MSVGYGRMKGWRDRLAGSKSENLVPAILALHTDGPRPDDDH
ncbi:MAG: hypothetical protein V1766_05135 [Pseudomonadota bacterium]